MDNRDGSLSLVPLTVTDLFDEALDLYKRDFALLAGIVAVVHVPAVILSWLIYRWLDLEHLTRGFSSASAEQQIFAVLGAMAASAVGAIGFGFVSVLESGALTVAVSERYLGRDISVLGAYRYTLRRVFSLVVTWGGLLVLLGLAWALVAGAFSLLAAVVLSEVLKVSDSVTGYAMAVVGGIAGAFVLVLCVALCVYLTPIVVVEGLGYLTAVQRNWALVRRRVWRLWITLLMMVVATSVMAASIMWSLQMLTSAFVFPMLNTGSLTEEITNAVIGAVVTMFFIPIGLVYITLSYYDARVRREGFDLALLEKQMRHTEGQA